MRTLWLIFAEGGMGMWPTLVLGVGAIGGALRYARRGDKKSLRFAGGLAVACAVVMTFAVMTNVDAVLRFVADDSRVSDADFKAVLWQGLGEASLPGVLGVVLLALSSAALVVGYALRSEKEASA